MVDAYHHALLGRFPRARYMPGKDAKFLWMPLQWMPEWLGDLIMFKFDPKQPFPPLCARRTDRKKGKMKKKKEKNKIKK